MEHPPMVGPVDSRAPPAALPAMFARYQGDLFPNLRRAIPSFDQYSDQEEHPGRLYTMLAYHMCWEDASGQSVDSAASRGKALRPTLCLFACDSLGGDWTKATPAASALELIHNFSLIHDDIQDGDVERRHQPTVWYIWGQPNALNAGNALRSVADEAALDLTKRGVSQVKGLKISQLLTEGIISMIQGQCLDLSFEGRLDIGPDDYLEMVSHKTGALIRCGTEIGALVASDDTCQVERYAYAGAHLGVAFQVRDDVLGIWGDEGATGKSAGNDILRRKKSFPVAYALEAATGPARERLVQVYSKEDLAETDVADVLTVLDDVGAETYAQRTAEERAELALAQVRELPLEPWAQSEFDELVQFLTARRY